MHFGDRKATVNQHPNGTWNVFVSVWESCRWRLLVFEFNNNIGFGSFFNDAGKLNKHYWSSRFQEALNNMLMTC